MYYIYHIAGIKIGCTDDLEKRMSDQGFTEWEILETHEDGWLAGDREQELQKEYGLPVDKVHYMISRQNRPKWNDDTRHKFTIEDCKKGGEAGKGVSISDTSKYKEYALNRPKSHADKIQQAKFGVSHSEERKAKISEAIRNNPKIECEHCSKLIDPRNFSRWHGDNCKHKKG